MKPISLSATHVEKHYGGVTALADGTIEINAGQVIALLGANGSGKSTLSKIITGVVAPDGGQLLLDDEPARFASPQVAKKYGITAVYQELSLIPDMTVAENIWLTHEPLFLGFRLDKRVRKEKTQDLLNLFEGTVSANLTPNIPVKDLTPDERQIVEILKALSIDPRLIILDEATASLDSQQVNRLFELIGQWKAEQKAIVFVSHRMDEIFRIADTAMVLRNGTSVGHLKIDETDEEEIVQLMIAGVEPTDIVSDETTLADAPVRLNIRDLQTDKLKGVDLTLRDGELLGIGGLQGQGQSDLLMALFGAIPFRGEVILGDRSVNFTHPKQAIKHDVTLVPGDRGREGLLLNRSILENIMLPTWGEYGVPINMQKARGDADRVGKELNIVMSDLDAPVSSLSGGNAQKVVISKWLLREPKLLLLNDPTKGIDVGAKGELYSLLARLRESGTAILFYSSDDEELLGLCDRIIVMHDGAISAELEGDRLTQTDLVSASMGTPQKQKHSPQGTEATD